MKPPGLRATQVRGDQPPDISEGAAGAEDPRELTYHYEGAQAGAEQRPNPREQGEMDDCEAHLSSEAHILRAQQKGRERSLEGYVPKVRRAEESNWYKQFAATAQSHHHHHQMSHRQLHQCQRHHQSTGKQATLMTAVNQTATLKDLVVPI
jgi:hypothetical protein